MFVDNLNQRKTILTDGLDLLASAPFAVDAERLELATSVINVLKSYPKYKGKISSNDAGAFWYASTARNVLELALTGNKPYVVAFAEAGNYIEKAFSLLTD